jgi:hypothetical protein
MQGFLEATMQFPDGWTEKETGVRLQDKEAKSSYWELINKSIEDDDIIAETFLSKLRELGIEIKIKDGKYFIDTNK